MKALDPMFGRQGLYKKCSYRVPSGSSDKKNALIGMFYALVFLVSSFSSPGTTGDRKCVERIGHHNLRWRVQ
jgi:hypothetical protein